MDKKKLFKYCFGCSPGIFPETVIVTPFIPVSRFAEHCETRESFKGKMYSGITAARDGKELSVVRCGIGDRLMGDAVLLLGLTSVQRIIFAGACGGLKDCRIGDLLVCENAFDGEGFTRYHSLSFSLDEVFSDGKLIPADPDHTEKLRSFLSENRDGMKAGDIFTIGSLMAERRENLLRMEEKGYIGIDMELSAVYHAARMIGRAISGILFVTDLPLRRPIWEKPTPGEREDLAKGMSELIRLSAEFAFRGGTD